MILFDICLRHNEKICRIVVLVNENLEFILWWRNHSRLADADMAWHPTRYHVILMCSRGLSKIIHRFFFREFGMTIMSCNPEFFF